MSRRREAPTVPLRSDYGHGSYRRCIVLEAGPGRARGELADDFHHFAATLDHDGAAVTAVRGEAIRVPWTTCPGAVDPLRHLVGAPLRADASAVARHADPRLQCTHLYDAACLAVACAARQAATGDASARRRYDFTLPDRRDGRTRPTLLRDGRPLLAWTVAGLAVEDAEPAVFGGRALMGAGWHALVDSLEDPDLAEAAFVMRRAVFIGLGRQYDFERIPRASAFAPVVGAACHTFGAGRVDEALRVAGSVRDFHDAPERILDREEPSH